VDSVLKQNKPSKNHCLSTLYRFQHTKPKVKPEEIVPTLPASTAFIASDIIDASQPKPLTSLECWLDVAVDVPLAALPAGMAFTDGVDYVWRGQAHEPAPQRGSVVLITWARRRCLGVVLGVLAAPRYDAAKVLPAVLLPALIGYELPEPVLKLAYFASQYYHRGIGEVLLPTISAALPAPKLPRAIADRVAWAAKAERHALRMPPATPEQAAVLSELGASSDFSVHLLYGVTGSGKSEVYFARAAQAIATDKQVLLLVPEIVLVPAMVARVKKALPNANVVALHSEIAPAQRRKAWAACLAGEVDVVVGTRLAVFAPLHNIGLIVVDEARRCALLRP
jgi:primosomal protein N' (replication factor Y) (superfamily II helicase)